jgi:hypothetical protein
MVVVDCSLSTVVPKGTRGFRRICVRYAFVFGIEDTLLRAACTASRKVNGINSKPISAAP